MHNKKKDRCGFEPAKMYWTFYSITNAFQMIFDAKSNFICYEARLIMKGLAFINYYYLTRYIVRILCVGKCKISEKHKFLKMINNIWMGK